MSDVKESKPTTYVLAILDCSGSMYVVAPDVIGGFNRYMEELRADKEHRYRVTLTRFNTRVEIVCSARKPKDVPKLDAVNYQPMGNTALYDAVCGTVAEFKENITLTKDDRVLVVIQTDGQENASTEHVLTDVQRLIAELEAAGTWAFLYHGMGPDAWKGGQTIGTQSGNTINTVSSRRATMDSYSGLSKATTRYAGGASGQTMGIAVAAAINPEDRGPEAA